MAREVTRRAEAVASAALAGFFAGVAAGVLFVWLQLERYPWLTP